MAKQVREISHWDIVRSFPAPVAVAYQQYCSVSDQDVDRKARALFAVAEGTARYLAFVLTADFLSIDAVQNEPDFFARFGLDWLRATKAPPPEPVRTPPWLANLRIGVGLEFGTWVGVVRDVSALLRRQNAFMPEAAALNKSPEIIGLLDMLNSLRNKYAHPEGAFALTDDEILALLRQGKPCLARWLSHLGFLARYPLCVARREDPFGSSQQSSPSFSLLRAMGLAPSHREVIVESSIPIREHLPFLVSPDAGQLLYLWPFVVTSEPEESSLFGKLFVFNKQKRANLNAIEYAGVGQRLPFELREHSEHHDYLWVRERRASLPGRLSVVATALEPVHQERPDTVIGAVFGEERKYRIVRRLGQGGMGTVYVATDDAGRTYAIKVLQHRDSRTQARFKREINELGKLKSTFGIVSLIDWGSGRDADRNPTPYYVMEYAERGDLSTFIRSMCEPLDATKDPVIWDLEPRLKILEDVAAALA